MRILLAVLCFFVLQAGAITFPVVVAKKDAGEAPIREARAKIVLSKLTYSAPDDSFSMDEVCAVDTTIPVYDARETNTVTIDPDTYYKVNCDSLVAGEVSTVRVGGLLALFIGGDMGTQEELKFVNLDLWVDPDGPINNLLAAYQGFAVDVSNLRIQSYLEPRVEYSCFPGQDDELHCTVDKPEFFSAKIDVYDSL